MARVLVVDDEQTDQVIMETLLERAGHDVYFAADGEHAFKSYLKNGIEIIITDLNMPHVDGLEFIEAVRALFPEAVSPCPAKGRISSMRQRARVRGWHSASPLTPMSSSRPSQRQS